ncbi:glucosaminidase domain-containing protein [Ascidiimonas aurantiaca]|uniref:glucosaminidase domain-containing protein n=1 Tax=Ascidiimonas aurantiaca TaxID=1685432 RepID=UPI0030EEFA79
MIRNICILLGAVFILSSCGSKKKVVQKKQEKNRKETQKPATPREWEPNVIAEEFVFFDISSTEEYIEVFKEIAKQNMRDYGIPASITLAQGILESGSGKGDLTRRTNNHFGIKCHKGWQGDRAYHDDDEIGECFRKYNHPMYSFSDHSQFLTSRSRYASLFKLGKDDYKGWARGLRKAGYATDVRYPQKLISLIERYSLYQYDKEVLKNKNREAIASHKRSHSDEIIHTVKKGDTLYSISRRYGLSVKELMASNRLSSTNISIGQELIIKSSK